MALRTSNSAANGFKDQLIPLLASFLEGTKSKGYSADWDATVSSAPSMIDHLNKLRNERFHVQEAQFKEQMHRVLYEDLSIGSGVD